MGEQNPRQSNSEHYLLGLRSHLMKPVTVDGEPVRERDVEGFLIGRLSAGFFPEPDMLPLRLS